IAVAPLVQQHARAQTIVATALGLQSPGAEEETVSDEGHRVGSLRVPRAQVMQQALKALDGDVASHAAGWFDLPSRWMQHHNAQVNRWAFVLHAAFALRRSASALHRLVPDAVDMADGWIVLADKGLAERLLPLS